MEKLPIFDPTAEPKRISVNFVARPATLQNLRIGLVENRKFNSDKLLLKIAAILEEEYSTKSHIIRSKRTASLPVEDEIIEELGESCDVVIAGVGD
jgi:hypothetical protein